MSVALVLGGANTLQADVAAYQGPVSGVVACNDAGYWWPGKLDAWVTLHPEHMAIWEAKRAGPRPRHFVGIRKTDLSYAYPVDLVTEPFFDGMPSSGSSGLFAAKVALVDLGFDYAVLCGIPLTVDGEHFFERGAWRPATDYQKHWTLIPDRYRRRMRSMSGWTKTHFGAPEPDFHQIGD